MATVTVNGKPYSGDSIRIRATGELEIDGVVVDTKEEPLTRVVKVVIEGEPANVSSECAVHCGDVAGSVTAGAYVKAARVTGDVMAGGNVAVNYVEGDISHVGGSVTVGTIDAE